MVHPKLFSPTKSCGHRLDYLARVKTCLCVALSSLKVCCKSYQRCDYLLSVCCVRGSVVLWHVTSALEEPTVHGFAPRNCIMSHERFLRKSNNNKIRASQKQGWINLQTSPRSREWPKKIQQCMCRMFISPRVDNVDNVWWYRQVSSSISSYYTQH